ncbi:hypothetical protein FM106_12585 [Brachybacterium faecium]|nr:hypothetical protein FM106_12585 [Brachybacterium faecium]
MNYRFNLIVSVGFCQPDDLLSVLNYLKSCLKKLAISTL